MKVTPEDIIKNIDEALQDAWQFTSIPDIIFVNSGVGKESRNP